MSEGEIKLIEPNVGRDAPLGVKWLQGEAGRKTMQLMGNPDKDIVEPTLESETERVRKFLDRKDQLNWMIEVDDTVVGAIWVDLVSSEELPSPSVHIMLGDPSVRSKGIGTKAVETVMNKLSEDGVATIYSRHLTSNVRAKNLLEELGFSPFGDKYPDVNNMTWQNVRKQNKES